MALNYTSFTTQIASIMESDSTTTTFQEMLPGAIDYAEQRIYRELDLLSTVVRDSSANLTSLNRNFALPSANGRFVTVQGLNIITPVGSTPDNGTRNPVVPIPRDYLDAVWNSASGSGVPKLMAMIDDENIILGPWPDNTYAVEVIGTIRPTPLSSGNATTFLTLYLPDLFVAAAMVYVSGWMRNFGSQADNPAQAVSWEALYKAQFQSAQAEELRKKFAGLGWSSRSEKPQVQDR